jgi:hypothetical protein
VTESTNSAPPISLSKQYVRAEQRTTDLMIALADMERERDGWRAHTKGEPSQCHFG